MLSDAELVPASKLKARRVKLPDFDDTVTTRDKLRGICRQFQEYCRQQALVKAALLKRLESDEGPLATAFAQAAEEEYAKDGELEGDSNPRVSLSPSETGKGYGGAYVQMWRYVSVDELSEDMQELAKEPHGND